MTQDNDLPEIRLDASDLYLEEMFTDRRVGSLRRLTPVDTEGNPDASRPTRYVGQAQLMTPAGALPLSFEIEAGSLAEALDKFPEAAQLGMEQTIRELQEMRREAASQIIMPDAGGPGGPGGMGGAGGGFGGLQMP